MKRKKENKNSENFFSNKILRENKIMKNIEVTQKFSVNGKEFNSLKEVNRYLLEEIISSTTIDEIFQNPEEYISQIRKYTSSTPEKSQNSEKRISVTEKKNMKDINRFLQSKNYEITRLSDTTKSAADWPVYILTSPENIFTFRYTSPVFQLYLDLEKFGIEKIVEMYKYTI